MDYRVGTCSSCRQSYRIPASFRHNQARCKSCGGVVSLAPLHLAPASAPRSADARRAPASEPVLAAPAAQPSRAEAATPAPPIAAVSVPEPTPRPALREPIAKAPDAVAHRTESKTPRPRSQRLKLVAWAAAVALVAACWWAFSSEKSSTAADSLRADSAAPADDAPRTGE